MVSNKQAKLIGPKSQQASTLDIDRKLVLRSHIRIPNIVSY